MKKLLLALGTIAAVAAPVASVIACGGDGNSNAKTFSPADDKYQAAVTKLSNAIKSADANAELSGSLSSVETNGDLYRLTFGSSDSSQTRITVNVKEGKFVSKETKTDANGDFIKNPNGLIGDAATTAVEAAAKLAGEEIAAIDAKPQTPAVGQPKHQTPATVKVKYGTQEFDTRDQAIAALEGDITHPDVWTLGGVEYDTEDAARTAFLASDAGKAMITTEGAKLFYVINNKIYSTDKLAEAEYISEHPVKTQGEDTITINAKSGAGTVAIKTTPIVTRNTATPTTVASATAKVTLSAGKKSGTNGAASVTAKTIIEQIQEVLDTNGVSAGAKIKTAAGTEHYYQATGDVARMQAGAKIAAKDLTDGGYTAAAKDFANIGGAAYAGKLKVDQTADNKGIIYTETSGPGYYFATVDAFIANYNKVHATNQLTKPTAIAAKSGVKNSEVVTYDIKYDSKTVGTLIVQSPEFGKNEPTSIIPAATIASLQITVAEKTPFEATVAADAVAAKAISKVSYEGILNSEGALLAASGLKAAAAGATTYKVNGVDVADVDAADDAVKAAAKPVKGKSTTKVIVDGNTYATKAAAITALIK